MPKILAFSTDVYPPCYLWYNLQICGDHWGKWGEFLGLLHARNVHLRHLKKLAFLLIRMLILIKSQGAFKTCSKKTWEWSLSSGERENCGFFEESLRSCLKQDHANQKVSSFRQRKFFLYFRLRCKIKALQVSYEHSLCIDGCLCYFHVFNPSTGYRNAGALGVGVGILWSHSSIQLWIS